MDVSERYISRQRLCNRVAISNEPQKFQRIDSRLFCDSFNIYECFRLSTMQIVYLSLQLNQR